MGCKVIPASGLPDHSRWWFFRQNSSKIVLADIVAWKETYMCTNNINLVLKDNSHKSGEILGKILTIITCKNFRVRAVWILDWTENGGKKWRCKIFSPPSEPQNSSIINWNGNLFLFSFRNKHMWEIKKYRKQYFGNCNFLIISACENSVCTKPTQR